MTYLDDEYVSEALFRSKNEDHILMQYVGLNDKNEQLIFEGDIIRYDEIGEINHWVAGEMAVVLWHPPRFTFRMKPYDAFTGCNQNMPSPDDSEYITVIGNIYENPELTTTTPPK